MLVRMPDPGSINPGSYRFAHLGHCVSSQETVPKGLCPPKGEKNASWWTT